MNANERRTQECEKAAEREVEANKATPSEQDATTTTSMLVNETTDSLKGPNTKGPPITSLLSSDSSSKTQIPSDASSSPSWPIVSPTPPLPTISEPSFFFMGGWYTQQFSIPNGRAFSDSEVSTFERSMEGYAMNLTNSPPELLGRINVRCHVLIQRINEPIRSLYGSNLSQPTTGVAPINYLEYVLSWQSIEVDVTAYSSLFASFINENLETLTKALQAGGLDVTGSFPVWRVLLSDSST